jgi:hypothetical protein
VRLWVKARSAASASTYSLKGAPQLGEAVTAVNQFVALRRQQKTTMTPVSRFVQEKAGVRVDVSASAEGHFRTG